MNEVKLGQLITDKAFRDAVHIAVAPVVAAEYLEPGEHVGLQEDGTASCCARPLIGIVDPFLRETLHNGQVFWLCLYPGTTHSLRHSWTHPAFTAKVPEVK